MARNNLLWVRDATYGSFDVGAHDDYGTIGIDLLWKARAGDTQGGLTEPAALDEQNPHAGTLALAGVLPSQDITGAVVKRIRLTAGFNLAPLASLPTERTELTRAGNSEGIAVMPYTLKALKVPASFHGPHPGGIHGSVTYDWLWWERRYSLDQGQKTFNIASTPVYESVYFYNIDTRCARRITEQGSSVYWFFSASPNNTLNGFVAAWSVLLELPSA